MVYLLSCPLLPMFPAVSVSPRAMASQMLDWQHSESPVRETQAGDLRWGWTWLGEPRLISVWWRTFGEPPPGAGEPGRRGRAKPNLAHALPLPSPWSWS